MTGSSADLTVLQVLEALEGGTARHLADLVLHTAGIHHHVAVPSERVGGVTDHAAAAAMSDAGALVHTVEMRRSPVHWRNAAALAELRRLVREVRPDVVHGHSSIGGALGRLAATGTPAARVYTPHGVLAQQPYLALERALGRRTDRLIAVSESEGEIVRRLGLAAPERIAVVPNGIASAAPGSKPPAVDLRAQLGLPRSVKLVGCVARLVPQKAPLDFVRICATVSSERPETHFLLVGSGPLQPEVEQEVRARGLGATFHRLAAVAEAASVLDQLDVFVNPSRFEGLPYGPLEAIRAGTPVVLSDAVGNRDVVEDGVSGCVLPVGDAAGMAAAVLRLLASEPLRRRFVAAGQRAWPNTST